MSRFAVLALLVTGLIGCGPAPAPPPIVIGHVADQTRLDKGGEQAEQGIRLALYELNKNDALTKALGGRKVEVRHTDTRGSLDAFEAEAVRLVSINRCVALLGGTSPQETAALDQGQVPLLTFSGYPAPGASTLVYCLGMSPASQGEALGKIVAEDAKVERIVLLADERRAESTSVTEAFAKTLETARKNEGAKPPSILTMRFGKDARWNEFMERMRAHNPHAIQFAGNVQDFNAWHRAFRQEVFLAEPLLIFAGEDGAARSFELDAKTKVVLATAYLPGAESEKMAGFPKAYQDAFHSDADVSAALAYDGFRILADALKRMAASVTPDRFRDDLQKELQQTKDFEGLTGKLSVTADRQIERTLFVARWQNGTLTKIKQFP